MAKEEVIGGLKNAIERGEPMEKAIQSFINSGYNPDEVREAARSLSAGGATAIIQPQKKEEASQIQEEKTKPKTNLIFIIILIIILLVVIGAVIVFLLFPDLVSNLLS